MSVSSLGVVDFEKRRRDGLEDVQIAGTNLVRIVVRRVRADLADLMTCSWNAFIQEIQWMWGCDSIIFSESRLD